MSLKNRLLQMALTPRTQLKQLAIGTLGALLSMVLIMATSNWSQPWLFYLLSAFLLLSVLYALPGYLGIWLWRMRKFFFDLD